MLEHFLADMDRLIASITALFRFPDTHTDATILALIVTAIIAMLRYLLKGVISAAVTLWMDHRKRRSAIIRFHNDVELWRSGFDMHFDDAHIRIYMDMVSNGPDDFRFFVGHSERLDIDEIKPFLHRLSSSELRCVRGYTANSELYERMTLFLGTDDFATMTKARKLKTLLQWHKIGLTTRLFAELAASEIAKRHHFVKRDAALSEMIRQKQEVLATKLSALSVRDDVSSRGGTLAEPADGRSA